MGLTTDSLYLTLSGVAATASALINWRPHRDSNPDKRIRSSLSCSLNDRAMVRLSYRAALALYSTSASEFQFHPSVIRHSRCALAGEPKLVRNRGIEPLSSVCRTEAQPIYQSRKIGPDGSNRTNTTCSSDRDATITSHQDKNVGALTLRSCVLRFLSVPACAVQMLAPKMADREGVELSRPFGRIFSKDVRLPFRHLSVNLVVG